MTCRTSNFFVLHVADQNCVELQEMGVVQRLVHLLNTSEDKVIHACVVLCLGVMAPICE